ncbi:MAG: ABC transporter substrate-binding protein [Treponema sp.]|jgi:branched-chain amino acid transport system substrate-binding protein|nr:ABC transporter substrate-binding protein [Treponema sp.]
MRHLVIVKKFSREPLKISVFGNSFGCFVFVILVLVFSSCAGGGQGRQGSSYITIGVLEPLTGVQSGGGNLELEGIELAHELNPEVNIGGKLYPVRLAVEDAKSEREDTVAAVQLLVDREKASVILGTWDSGLASVASDVIRRSKIPAIGITCTGPRITAQNDYYFRICFNDASQANALAKYANDALGTHRGIIIYEQNNSAFETLHNDIIKRFEEFFVTYRSGRKGYNSIIDEFEIYAGVNQDFSGMLAGVRRDPDELPSIREVNPDVIFIAADYQEAVQIIRQAKSLGFRIPIIGTANLDTPDFFAAGGESLEGLFFASHYNLDVASTPRAATFIREYKARNDNLNPSAVTALAYDAYLLALDAIERAQSTDPEKIRTAIAATRGNFAGVTGQIILDSNGDAQRSVFIKAVENGNVTLKTTVNPVSVPR